MRRIAILLALAACGGNGVEEAKRQAAADDKDSKTPPAKKMSTPVPNSAHVPCSQLIDVDAFAKGLGEADMAVTDTTKAEPEAAASCSLMKGGKRPTEAEQKVLLKNAGKLGVMPGDELCNVTAFCWTIEDADRFRKKCSEVKTNKADDTMGTFSCVRTIMTGEFDVFVFRFFNADTKCLLQVRGGPSMTDNDFIRQCAKTARDSIGPAQIAVKP